MGVSSLRQACHYSMYPGYGLMVHTHNFNYNYKSVLYIIARSLSLVFVICSV